MYIYEHCKNCKYLILYYVKTDFHFRPARGLCACAERSIHYAKLLERCDYWEEKEKTFEDTKKSVEETIGEINERLYDILEILNLEKN